MNMLIFKNPVIQYENAHNTKMAAVDGKWNRPIIISDSGIQDKINMQTAGAIIPSGASSKEINDIKNVFKSNGVKISCFIDSAAGIVEYYKQQKAINSREKELIIIEVDHHFTDICYVTCKADRYYIKNRLRVDYGIDYVAECLVELPRYKNLSGFTEELSSIIQVQLLRSQLPREKLQVNKNRSIIILKRQDLMRCIRNFLATVMASIDTMMFRENANNGTLLLAGKLWDCPETVQMMKDRYRGRKIVSYKPEVAALLGGVYYVQKYYPMQVSCSIDSKYSTLHHQDIWGVVNRLNRKQKDGYWKLLEAILNREKEVLIECNTQDLYVIYDALRIDYPEIVILWSYAKSSCYRVGTANNPITRFVLSYKNDGVKLLEKIDEKAESILRSCISVRTDCSDHEIVEKLYWHISRFYHYTKEKSATGNFPDYAYTLETLLRCGVCHGYAISMIYLFRKLQIPIRYVGGDADGRSFGGHAWNLISTIDGEYRHLDITWDLEKAQSNRAMKYFLLDDIGMKARKHFWNPQEYPMCI